GRGQSGAHEGTLFRGRRHRWTRLRRELRPTPKERRALACGRAGPEGRGAGPGRSNAAAADTRGTRARATEQAQRERLVKGRRRARTVASSDLAASTALVTSLPRR